MEDSNNSKIIYRSLRSAIWITLIIAGLNVIYYNNPLFATDLLIGAGWSILNLWLLTLLIREFFSQDKKRRWIIFLLFLKFPLLYGTGYVILKKFEISLIAIILGFSLPFLVIVLKAMSLIIFRIHHKERGEGEKILWWREWKRALQK